MLQHVILISVSAPLIVLGAPWMSIWRPLPLEFRRGAARAVARARWAAPLRRIGAALGRPRGAWLAFSVSLVVWHIPVLYDLTLRYLSIHVLEHLMFLTFAILLWAQALESPPLRRRLSAIHAIYYMVGASVVGWVISLVLAFSPTPLYPLYAHLANRPGGLSALADQQLAAGIMLVFGSLSTTIYVFVGLYRWLGADGAAAPRAESAARPTTAART
jgi:cytochrome c oxidase assembly factor CtaG